MTLKEAIDFILNTIELNPDPEIVPIERANGRFLAKPLSSHDDIPPFDNSQVDGYAVNSKWIKLKEISDKTFFIKGDIVNIAFN